MILSRSGEYALRAVLYLAQRPGQLVRVGEISDALDVPQNYLSKVLHVLGRRGVLSSQRGPQGGFELGVPPEELTLAAVVEPFDPVEGRALCLLRRQRCSDSTPCVAHHAWKDLAGRIRSFFQEATVAALLEEARASGEAVDGLLARKAAAV